MSQPIFVSIMAPFAAPVTRLAQEGASCAEIVAQAYASGALDRAWDEALHLYIGDSEMPRALWAKAKPRAGALVALRPRARYTFLAAVGSWFVNYGWAYLVEAAAYAATAYGISTLTAADPDTLSFDPRFSIDGARNEARPYASWNAVLGTHRVFPPHAAKQYTRTDGDKVWLHALLSLGLAPVKLDTDSLQIGDTPLSNYPGASFAVKEKPGDPIPAPWAHLTPDEDDGPGLINASDDWVTRTISASDAGTLEVEAAWLEGLVRITSGGKRDGITIQLRIRYRKVGDSDWREFGTGFATGDGAINANGSLIDVTGKTELPFRKVFRRSGLTPAQYEIGVKRVTEDYDNPNIRTKFGWMKIRSFSNTPPVIDDNLALLAVTIEAGPQANNVIDQLNCIISRVAPVWDDEEEEWGAADETSNPAALTRWIGRGPGMARPYGDDEFDDAAWGAWFELCVEKDWRCDLDVRAGAGADPEELMQAVARCGRATIGRRGGKLVPVLDTLQDAPTQLFTPRNSWGLTARRQFRPKTQAYRVQFNNAAKNYVLDEMIVYFPGYNAGNLTLAPELLSVTGKTRGVEVYREAKRRIAEMLLRGMDYTFRTDWEHFATARGKRIAFAHWDVAVGRVSGRVTAVELNEAVTRVVAIQLDEEVTQTLGEDYAISWRRVNAEEEEPTPGMAVEALGVTTTPGVSRWIELAADGGIPIADAPKAGPDGRPGDLVTFGDADIQTLDLVVGQIRRGPHYEAEIGAAAYVPALYDDDDAPEPEWSSNVSGDAFPAPPAPEIYGQVGSPSGMFAGFDFPPGTGDRVVSIELYRRSRDDTLDDEPARWEPMGVLPPTARIAAFPAGRFGETYALQLIAVGRYSRTASEVIEITSGAAPERVETLWQDDEPDAGAYAPGTYWFDTDDDNAPYQLVAGVWQDATGDALAEALLAAVLAEGAAGVAQATADGKVTTFYQTSAPTAEGVGDLWHDTDDAQRRTYRWNGSAWQAITDQTAYNVAAAISGQGALATQDYVIFAQNSAPTSPQVGWFWHDTDDPQRRTYRWSGSAWVHVTDQTAVNVAASIASQGALATLNTVDYSKLVSPFSANMIYAPNFEDESAWVRVGGMTFFTAGADAATAALNVIKSVGVSGNGTTSQTQSTAGNVPALFIPVVPGEPIYARFLARKLAGFTGRLSLNFAWYPDKSTDDNISTASVLDTDHRSSALVANTNVILEGVAVAPAGAAFLRLRVVCPWSTTLNNGGGFRAGAFAAFRATNTGRLLVNDAGIVLGQTDVVTSEGVASSVTGQSPLATTTPPSYAGNSAAYTALGAGQLYTDTSDSNKIKTTVAPAATGLKVTFATPDDFDTILAPGDSTSISFTPTIINGSGDYTYMWTQLSGDAGSINTPTAAATTITYNFAAPGTKEGLYQLRVRDDDTGETATAIAYFQASYSL